MSIFITPRHRCHPTIYLIIIHAENIGGRKGFWTEYEGGLEGWMDGERGL